MTIAGFFCLSKNWKLVDDPRYHRQKILQFHRRVRHSQPTPTRSVELELGFQPVTRPRDDPKLLRFRQTCNRILWLLSGHLKKDTVGLATLLSGVTAPR